MQVFKFLVSGTHQFDVSTSICVSPGYVLGLLFWILWLVYRFTGNPEQSWVPLVMKQHHQSIACTSKSPSADRSISLLYMQGQVGMNGHLAGTTVSSASSSPLTCEIKWLSFSCVCLQLLTAGLCLEHLATRLSALTEGTGKQKHNRRKMKENDPDR